MNLLEFTELHQGRKTRHTLKTHQHIINLNKLGGDITSRQLFIAHKKNSSINFPVTCLSVPKSDQ